jgi:hypothetical protein
MTDAYWTNTVSKEELETYLDFWKEISPEERETIIRYSFSPGELEDFSGTQQAYFKLNDRLGERLAGFNLGEYNRIPLSEFEKNPNLWESEDREQALRIARSRHEFAVRAGFDGMVEHILFGVNNASFSSQYRDSVETKMVEMYRDIPRLEESMEEWLADRPSATNALRG